MSPTEADGVACVDVSDPKTGASFRLYDFEYQLALQLNGQPVAQVTDWASKTYGADLTADGITRVRGAPGGARVSRGTGGSVPPAPASRTRSASGPGRPASRRCRPTAAAEEWDVGRRGRRRRSSFPTPAMLDSAPEPTPVAPLDLAELAAGPRAPRRKGRPPPSPPEITAPGDARSCRAKRSIPSESLRCRPARTAPCRRRPSRMPPPSRAGRRISTERCNLRIRLPP